MIPLLLAIAPVLAALSGAAAPAGPADGSRQSVVMLPLENLSGAPEAPDRIAFVVAGALEARGYRALDGEAVEEFLETRRIRRLDSLPAAARTELLSLAGASSLLSGTIFTYREGPNAAVAVMLRLIRPDGRMAWERFSALEAKETGGFLGLGGLHSTDEILRRLSKEFERSLPAPGEVARAAAERGKPLGRARPRTFRSDVLAPGQTHRVVVLPFQNLSRDLLAPKLVGAIVSSRLRASEEFEVVDPADVRAAVVASGTHSITAPDPAELRKLGERLGTQLFLTGTIYSSRDAFATGQGTPEFELDVNLIDAAAGRVVWSGHHARKGTDYEGLLELGGIVGLPALTDQVVVEMIQSVEDARPVASHAAESKKSRSEKS